MEDTSFSLKETLLAFQREMNERFDKVDDSHKELCDKVEGLEQILSFAKGATFVISAVLVWIGWPEFKHAMKGLFS